MSVHRTLRALRLEFHRNCGLLGVKRELHLVPQHDGSPHMEYANSRFHFVVTERGSEFERRTTSDADEALFWLVSGVVFELAMEFELRHRVPGQDFRRLLFAKEIELMEGLSPEWATRTREHVAEILREHPFDDREPMAGRQGRT